MPGWRRSTKVFCFAQGGLCLSSEKKTLLFLKEKKQKNFHVLRARQLGGGATGGISGA
jgi:hypothetical protein